MANSTTIYTLRNGERALDVTENKTLDITDQGIVQVVKTDAIVVTLPATVVGYRYIVENGGVKKTGGPFGTGDDGSVLVAVSPNASDLIAGMGVTAADDKDFLNTKATAKVGDRLEIIGNGTTGWNVTAVRGIWARES